MSVISLLLVAWLVGRAVASSPYPDLASQVRRSAVMTTVDGLVPDAGRECIQQASGLPSRRQRAVAVCIWRSAMISSLKPSSSASS